jgi:hypothetical protein
MPTPAMNGLLKRTMGHERRDSQGTFTAAAGELAADERARDLP